MTLGHRWIVDNLGAQYLPETAWHIDPQGHIGATAAMFGLMRLQNFVINRMPQSVKESLQQARELEFVWQGLPSTTNLSATKIFTRVLDQ